MPDDAIQFRMMTTADIPVGLELCRLARWNQLQRDWELFLHLSPKGCRVAVKDGRVVGTVTTVSYQDRFSWIGMVLVDPAERRQGIGTKLLQEALDVLKQQRLVGLDATPAGREVYVKLGFVDESRLSRMEITGSTDIAVGENNPARQMAESDLQAVWELDQSVFGADRRELLEWLVAGAPEYAWIIRRDGKVAGYTFGRHGFNFEHLGPVIAEDGKVAEQLVSACLAECGGKRFILDATHDDAEWRQWLISIGFREQRPFVRMFRGEDFVPDLCEQQFAILGPEFG
jgi:GNAT superfamily N-acetyltransferase